MMKKGYIFLFVLLTFSCGETVTEKMTVQQIVDKSIEVCGGDLYENSKITFDFRDRSYMSEFGSGRKILTRILRNDTVTIRDVRTSEGLQRFVNDTLTVLNDSLSNVYANSVNSVHYFSKLPYGLNDPAVKKERIGEVNIRGHDYHKIKVTFEEAGGGDDFDDIYVYWINMETMKPDYLGYTFHVDGGGTRFRVAYNERYINGIRFVDYENLKPKDSTTNIFMADSLYLNNGLELLSKIELKNVTVSQDSYN